MTPADPFSLASRVAELLGRAGVRYVIGGSVAASIYGEPRATLDLDIMIEAGESDVRELIGQLAPDFYVDEEMAVDAVKTHTSFNAIDLDSAMKIDFFIAEDDSRTRRQLDRRRRLEVHGFNLWFYSAEDILVRKLVWFRLGGEQSDRQWRDVLGILRLSGAAIDETILRRVAEEFEVGDLLDRAIGDAGYKRP